MLTQSFKCFSPFTAVSNTELGMVGRFMWRRAAHTLDSRKKTAKQKAEKGNLLFPVTCQGLTFPTKPHPFTITLHSQRPTSEHMTLEGQFQSKPQQ